MNRKEIHLKKNSNGKNNYSNIHNVFFGTYLQGQNVRLMYEVTFKPKLNDSAKVTERMILKLNKEKQISFFDFDHSSQGVSLNSKILKNFKKPIFVEYESVAMQLYHTDYIFTPKWNLLNETKTILGYRCRNAEIKFGNREWIAWYSEDLPFQDGPYKFYGLPGLILEIFSQDGDYHFTAKALEKESLSDIALPQSTSLKPEQLESLKLEAVKNPAAQFISRVSSMVWKLLLKMWKKE